MFEAFIGRRCARRLLAHAHCCQLHVMFVVCLGKNHVL